MMSPPRQLMEGAALDLDQTLTEKIGRHSLHSSFINFPSTLPVCNSRFLSSPTRTVTTRNKPIVWNIIALICLRSTEILHTSMIFVQRSMILLYKILEYLPPLSRCSLSCLTGFPLSGPAMASTIPSGLFRHCQTEDGDER